MYAENDARAAAPRPAAEGENTQRVYTLLSRLSADVRRLETLVRAMKKTLEERENS